MRVDRILAGEKQMITEKALRQIGPVEWEIPLSYRSDMRVAARFFASKPMVTEILGDRSLEQLVDVASLPGIVGFALAMPDIHEGYGFPIGGVAATQWPDGAISPGGIGYDINCGVRLLTSEVMRADFAPFKEALATDLSYAIPSGTGQGGKMTLDFTELDQVLTEGVGWMLKKGYAEASDIDHIESHGKLAGAEPSAVSDFAKKRGCGQLGTLGSGNHFVEVGYVEKIFNEEAARVFGLKKDLITILIHTGSRGLGHQVATDYIKIMLKALPEFGITVPNEELACLPFSSPEGQRYFTAMSAAANFAWANRQMITYRIREAWKRCVGKGELSLVYDVAHNIAKVEEHEVNGKVSKVIVHRKGATRAFGKDFAELPAEYKVVGQPVIIPGSMGTSSYVMVGAPSAMQKTFGSACHGAGRVMSRHAAKAKQLGRELQNELASEGVIVKAAVVRDLSEEAPYAYKDVDDVVNVIETAGIATKVAQLRPLIVIKG
jgi:tRNA-splicing ligase RtcB